MGAMETPPPPASQMPLAEKKESLAFTNYVALSLAKLPPALYRRAKKRISDVLYWMEEQNDIEPGRCNVSMVEDSTHQSIQISFMLTTLMVDPPVLFPQPAICITKPLMFPVETRH